jgi:hypothetical protein
VELLSRIVYRLASFMSMRLYIYISIDVGMFARSDQGAFFHCI